MEIVPLLPESHQCTSASGMIVNGERAGPVSSAKRQHKHFLVTIRRVTFVLIVMKSADVMLRFLRCTPVPTFALDL